MKKFPPVYTKGMAMTYFHTIKLKFLGIKCLSNKIDFLNNLT